jgi:hypothetical protein
VAAESLGVTVILEESPAVMEEGVHETVTVGAVTGTTQDEPSTTLTLIFRWVPQTPAELGQL